MSRLDGVFIDFNRHGAVGAVSASIACRTAVGVGLVGVVRERAVVGAVVYAVGVRVHIRIDAFDAGIYFEDDN